MNNPALLANKSTRIIRTALLVTQLLGTALAAPSAEATVAVAQAEPVDTRMDWWREARFGMFIHWGLYAVPGGDYKGATARGIGEWIMDELDIPVAEYEKFAGQFNPVKFNADEWVAIAKNAGMKYIVITAKHHEGFCLWDSQITNYDIMDATPFKRDILAELATACRREGIRLCFYYSIIDWHHPQAQAPLFPHYNAGHKDQSAFNPEFPQYFQNYLKPQIKELLTKYGDIGVVWFDGDWIPDYTTAMGKELYAFIREIQPKAIINNRVDKGRDGMAGMNVAGQFVGDFGTPEQEIPDRGITGSDWESCITMNKTWGFKFKDNDWKSETKLIQSLVEIASKGGNFLLNVGPTGEGLIPGPSVERLKAMGAWLKINGESIYGTQASPYAKPAWGRYTAKAGVLYAHIYDWPTNGRLPISSAVKVKAISLLGGSPMALQYDDKEAAIILPQANPGAAVTVVKIEL